MRTTTARAGAAAMVAVLGLAAGCAPADDGAPADDAAPATTEAGTTEAAGGDLARVAAAGDDGAVDDAEASAAEVAEGFDDFGMALLADLHDPEEEANTALSGLSAGVTLSMVLAGAEGETAEEIATALGIDENAPADGAVSALLLSLAETGDVELTLANAVWTRPDYPLTEAFRTAVTERFGASPGELDLADPEQVAVIDEWAADRTDGLVEQITDSLDGVPGEAVMVLANATHFAGDWLEPFDAENTAPGMFTRDGGETVEADLMRRAEASVAIAVDRDRGLLLARLPYGAAEGDEEVDPAEARFGLEVLVPTDDTPLARVLDELDAADWRELSEQAAMEHDLPVTLPRFAVESDHDDLDRALQAQGIEAAYDPARADFTGMSPADPWLGEVAQKAVVEVDEAGTEAAAVTAAAMVESGPPVEEVVVDRSFAFTVRDTATSASLFTGAVDDPTVETDA